MPFCNLLKSHWQNCHPEQRGQTIHTSEFCGVRATLPTTALYRAWPWRVRAVTFIPYFPLFPLGQGVGVNGDKMCLLNLPLSYELSSLSKTCSEKKLWNLEANTYVHWQLTGSVTWVPFPKSKDAMNVLAKTFYSFLNLSFLVSVFCSVNSDFHSFDFAELPTI